MTVSMLATPDLGDGGGRGGGPDHASNEPGAAAAHVAKAEGICGCGSGVGFAQVFKARGTHP